LHPDRGHERVAGIHIEPDTDIIPEVFKKPPTISTGVLAAGIGALILVWLPIFVTLKKRAQFTGCQSNLRQIALAMQAYAQDNDGNAPEAYNWEGCLMPYLKDRNALICPARPGKVGYAFNLNLNEAPLSHLNNSGTLIAFFEADGGKSLSGTQGAWLNKLVHSKGNNLVFVDGSVRASVKPPANNFWGAKIAMPPTPTPVPAAPNAGAPIGSSGVTSSGVPQVSSEAAPVNPPINPLPPGATPTNPPAPGTAPTDTPPVP
jgi:prepilin-type processing-associated H-X9-DG protein